MTDADPAAILSRAGLWLSGLRERGLVTPEQADRLNLILAESFGERLDQNDDPLLVIMLCGPTAVGKSSLINTLAGADISRPGTGAATAAAVLYVHERDDPARLFAYSHALAGRDQPGTTLVRHNRDALLHKVLVDTPDIDSVRLRHRELTAQLVHAADLVLFVTSPEKYKVLRSARWVLEQRGQRGLAFVLNKWDRSALGLQSDQRAAIEADFRAALAEEGFANALVFKLSTLADPGGFENDLPALRAWLETGLSQSTAALLRQRRLRAAWGRLAAAIESVLPEPLSAHPLLPRLHETLAVQAALAEQGVAAEAVLLEPMGIEDAGRPSTPGLLGMWNRGWQRLGFAGASLRAAAASLTASSRATPSGADRSLATSYGARHAGLLSDALVSALGDAAAQGMPLGVVVPAFHAALQDVASALALLPAGVAAELARQAGRRSLRRFIGTGVLYLVELLILAVLLIAVGRTAADFWHGTYAPAGLLASVVLLVGILLIVGQTLSGMFFPLLRRRFQRLVEKRAGALLQDAVRKGETILRDHVTAVDRLAEEGRDLLRQIDRSTLALAAEGESSAAVHQLFAEGPPPPLSLPDEMVVPQPQLAGPRRPVFD